MVNVLFGIGWSIICICLYLFICSLIRDTNPPKLVAEYQKTAFCFMFLHWSIALGIFANSVKIRIGNLQLI